MDPKARARIDAGIGGAAFVLALLRGKDTLEAQADARAAVGVVSPLVEEALPYVERAQAEREARRAANAPASASATPCKTRGCRLAAGHVLVLGCYHEDANGVLFSEENER